MIRTAYSPVFFEPQLQEQSGELSLSPEEASHAIRVLRVRIGDNCVIVDGRRLAREGIVRQIGKMTVTIQLGRTQESFGEPKLSLILALGLSANDRFDSALTAAIEAGVARVQPVICQLGKFTPSAESQEKRQARWQRLAIAAIKQSRQASLPELAEPVLLAEWLDSYDGTVIPFSPTGDTGLRPLEAVRGKSSAAVLIGPVAGFSDDEEGQFRQRKLAVVSLGPRILRFETAVPVAIALTLAAAGEYS